MNARFLSATLAVCLGLPGFLSTPLQAQLGPAIQPHPSAGAESATTVARRDLLERLDRVQGKGPKLELTASLVRTSKAAGKLLTIPFKPGSENMPVAGGQTLLDMINDARIQALLGRGAMVIILGYPDSEVGAHGGGMPTSARRAAAVQKFLVSVAEVKATMASFGASPSASGVPAGGAEVWVILP